MVKNRVVLSVLTIVGTVIGSGFISGKEIVVFFSRFGYMSYYAIAFAFLLFWGLFHFFLKYGSIAVKQLDESIFAKLLNIIICFVFSSAMFAGIFNITENLNVGLKIFIYIAIIFYSIKIVLSGLGFLEKINMIIVPFMILTMLFNLLSLTLVKSAPLFKGDYEGVSFYYSLLYVVLNTSNSAVLVANVSKNLNKKQKARVGFISALALCLILLFANTILLQNSFAFSQDMPILFLFKGFQKTIMSVIVLFGCVTTLFSLNYTISGSLRGVCNNNIFIIFFSVFVPIATSLIGFGNIVTLFYPLTSVLGLFLLGELFFKSFFKQVYKHVHSACKKTK